MKRHLLFILMMMLPIVASAYIGVIVVDGVKYDISTKEQTAKAIGLSDPDYSGVVVIHGVITYEGRDCYVSEVNGFRGCKGITSLIIEEGVTTIDIGAFQNCINLNTISLPKTIDHININTFIGTAWIENLKNQEEGIVYLSHIAMTYNGDKTKVTNLSIKEGTTVIGIACFSKLEALQTVNFPSTLKVIGEQAFLGCSSLSSISLRDLKLGNNAFKDCTNLKEVSLSNVLIEPDYRGYVGISPFAGCSALEKVSVNAKEIQLGFCNLPSITTLILGEDIEYIGETTFMNCTGIKNVELPSKLKYLSGFSGCTGLTSIQIPSSVIEIGNNAFNGCTGLTSLVIPNSINRISNSSFSRCSSLASVKLPEGLITIDDFAFEYSGVIDLTLPQSVDTIGYSAFGGCENLSSISFPQKNIVMSEGSFWGCNNLKSVSFPEGQKVLSKNLLNSCQNLQTIIIPSSVDSLYGGTFGQCKDLTEVYCYSPTVPTTLPYQGRITSPFIDSDIQYATLYVPVQSIDSYKAALYWKDFKEIVAIPGYDAKKCATPQISYKNGKLSYSCDTEGASFTSEIKDTDIKKYNVSEIDLSVSYNIQVFATASGCAPSDTVRATLCWLDATPTVIGIDNIRQEKISANPVLIQTMDGTIYIKGLENGTKVYAYDTEGLLKGSVRCKGEECYLPTNIKKGNVAIIKIGEKSIKIIMQ